MRTLVRQAHQRLLFKTVGLLTRWDPTMHSFLWTHVYRRAWRWPVYRL